MLNALYEQEWDRIKIIGFDIDGTLYDEMEFIKQPYLMISELLKKGAFEFMLYRWLEKGSSYNKLFAEAFSKYGSESKMTSREFVEKALKIFRSSDPLIRLSSRAETILDYCSRNYDIFIVSDGNPELQRKKYYSLGLDKYFDLQNVVFTGDYSEEYEKPNPKSAEILGLHCTEALYFGDREIDRNYARFCGMQFQKVYNMIGCDI